MRLDFRQLKFSLKSSQFLLCHLIRTVIRQFLRTTMTSYRCVLVSFDDINIHSPEILNLGMLS